MQIGCQWPLNTIFFNELRIYCNSSLNLVGDNYWQFAWLTDIFVIWLFGFFCTAVKPLRPFPENIWAVLACCPPAVWLLWAGFHISWPVFGCRAPAVWLLSQRIGNACLLSSRCFISFRFYSAQEHSVGPWSSFLAVLDRLSPAAACSCDGAVCICLYFLIRPLSLVLICLCFSVLPDCSCCARSC